MRKPILLSACILFFSAFMLNISTLHAQTTWHTYQTTSQVQIDYSDPVNCSFNDGEVQMEYIFLKINNLTNSTIKLTYRVEYYYIGTGCATCTNNEYLYTVNIPAKSSITTNCDFKTTGQSKLAIFKRYLNRANKVEFEKFEISNIVIE